MKKLGLFRYAIGLTYRAAPVHVIVMVVLILLQGVTLPLSIYLSKLAIESVGTGGSILTLTALWALSIGLNILVEPLTSLLAGAINEKLTAHVAMMLMRKADEFPDLSPFEDPAFYNEVQLLGRQATHRPLNTVTTSLYFSRDLVSVLGVLSLLGTLAWWLPLLLLSFTYPHVLRSMKLQEMSWNTLVGSQADSRAMDYFRTQMLSEAPAKEVRLFGLGAFFMSRYRNTFERLHSQMNRDRRRQAIQPVLTAMLSLLGNVSAFVWVVRESQTGRLGAGDLLVLVQALFQLQLRLSGLTTHVSLLSGHLKFFESLKGFMGRTPTVRSGPRGADFGRIEFRNVSFRYPDGREALQDVSFVIEPGAKIALVGENGAGKSTLIKLLCRFYDPTEGQILINGTDLRELALDQWRGFISAVFQDFGKYYLTVRENLALGNLELAGNDEELLEAARRSGFLDVVDRLPRGLDAMLGKPFGGTELSGGQWQKLAITRAYIRPAKLLILDEPTAALDPRAEYELYQQFTHLAQDKTVVLVTHRLASVQMADQILVLQRGRLIEQGSHPELMRQMGEYAKLYRMQAEQYKLEGVMQIDS